MSLNNVDKLGQMLGSNKLEQDNLKNNLSPDEEFGNIVLKNKQIIGISGSVLVTKYLYPSTSFILDHPVYGELDSSTLQLDGGYLGGSTLISSSSF